MTTTSRNNWPRPSKRRRRNARLSRSPAAAASAFTPATSRARNWMSPGIAASFPTSRPSWWSPPAPARRWLNSKQHWPTRARCSPSRRPYAGAARDFVLGTRIINGKGEILRFGGEVMKNVAGYDVSRLMVGALGSLGVLLEVSLKVLPKPAREVTLCFEMPADKAIQTMNTWGAQPLPLSAACHAGETLYVRLSGTELGVQAARAKLGGKPMDKGNDFWREIREHRHSFFQNDVPLWRLSVPPAALPIDLPGKWLIDWGGAQRWLKSDASATDIRMQAEKAGGHATLFRHAKQNGATFHPLPAQLATLHQNLKRAFDPDGIMNRVVAV